MRFPANENIDRNVLIAISTIKKMNFCGICTTGHCESCERYITKKTVKKALDSFVPAKPVLSQSGKHTCPECGKMVKKNNSFCKSCGKALDWKGVEEC